jgi:hypothetical protein
MRPLFVLPGVLLAVLSSAQVTVEKIDYEGWAGSYRITNGTVDLVVVPQVGRVMRYGYVDGPNLLWENEALLGKAFPADARTYRAYGGDKMWVAPQSLWNWPPDPAIDGSPWKVEPTPNGVRMTSSLGSKVKVSFRRDISLAPVGTGVTFTNAMTNRGPRQPLAIWQVTQLNNPDAVTMQVEVTREQPAGWHGYGNDVLDSQFESLRNNTLTLKRNPQHDRKFGARSLAGVLSAAFGATRMYSESKAYARNVYPDRNSAQQVYLAADPDKYVELEHVGPLTRMESNETVLQTVKWRLERG